MQLDLAQARATLTAATERTADLLDSIPDGAVAVAGSAWTVGEVGAHLVGVLTGFTAALQGDFDPVPADLPDSATFRDRLSVVTAGTLEAVPERETTVLATLLADASRAFLAASAAGSSADLVRTPWYGPTASVSLGATTCLLVGEQLVHGYDIAKTLGRPWPISPADALLSMGHAEAILPLAVNPETARGHTACYELRPRGGIPLLVRFRDGVATVEPPGSHAVDCHLWADPVDLMLVVYGRVSHWGPMIRGRLRAWGRKPWLALRFKNLFFNP